MSEYAIETENLVKYYNNGKVKAVDGIDLKVKKGEIFAFIGANGSGKTTTIDCLSGILTPTSGKMKIWGMDQPKFRKKLSYYIGIAPQEYALYVDLTVWENLIFFGKLYGLNKKMIEETANELIGILDLDEKRNIIAENLSGGMKRRLSIACALIHKPAVLLFDEATVGVDPVLRSQFWDYFRDLRDNGKTILITSHVMDEAEKADRIGLMRNGKLIEIGKPSELKEKYDAKSIEEVFIKLSGGEKIDK